MAAGDRRGDQSAELFITAFWGYFGNIPEKKSRINLTFASKYRIIYQHSRPDCREKQGNGYRC